MASVTIGPVSDSIAISISDFRSKDITPTTLTKIKHFNPSSNTTYIIDLRDNNGGYIYEAIKFGALFVTKNELITIKKSNQEPVMITRPPDHPTIPANQLIILINNQTASAAEATSYILQHHPNHMIIGTKSHGKKTIHSTNINRPYQELMIPIITPHIPHDWAKYEDNETVYLKALALSHQRKR